VNVRKDDGTIENERCRRAAMVSPKPCHGIHRGGCLDEKRATSELAVAPDAKNLRSSTVRA
jgi:hypothetical protein